jgi:hypothetical protein
MALFLFWVFMPCRLINVSEKHTISILRAEVTNVTLALKIDTIFSPKLWHLHASLYGVKTGKDNTIIIT